MLMAEGIENKIVVWVFKCPYCGKVIYATTNEQCRANAKYHIMAHTNEMPKDLTCEPRIITID